MLPQLEQICAKRLAMNAHSFIEELETALTSPADRTPELTGWLLHAMPGIYERAILTSPHIRSDQAVAICERFFPEFAQVVRLTSNAGGFSNPLKKFMFNVAFGRMFERESSDLRTKILVIWDRSREDHGNPLDYLAIALLMAAESKAGAAAASDERVESVRGVLANRFAAVHEMCR